MVSKVLPLGDDVKGINPQSILDADDCFLDHHCRLKSTDNDQDNRLMLPTLSVAMYLV
jgi:hypothetical protein